VLCKYYHQLVFSSAASSPPLGAPRGPRRVHVILFTSWTWRALSLYSAALRDKRENPAGREKETSLLSAFQYFWLLITIERDKTSGLLDNMGTITFGDKGEGKENAKTPTVRLKEEI